MVWTAWLAFISGVGGMTLAQVLLARANPTEKLPFWWGIPSIDPLSSKVLRGFGAALAVIGAYLVFQSMNLGLGASVALILGGVMPFVMVSVIHNFRIGKQAKGLDR